MVQTLLSIKLINKLRYEQMGTFSWVNELNACTWGQLYKSLVNFNYIVKLNSSQSGSEF